MAVAALFCAFAILKASYLATCIGLFFTGCIVDRLAERLSRQIAYAGLAAAILFTVAVALSPFGRHWILAVSYGLLPALLLVVTQEDLRSPFRRWRWVGETTYGTYLLHIPILTVLQFIIRLTSNPAGEWWFLCLYLGIVLVAAWLAFRFIEKPAQDAILNLAKRKSSASSPSQPKA